MKSRVAQLKDILSSYQSTAPILCIGHTAPDGDAIGAAMAWVQYLKSIGLPARAIFPSRYPAVFEYLDGLQEQIIAKETPIEAEDLIREAKLIFCLDFNQYSRTAELATLLEESSAYKIHIDHHLYPDAIGDIIFSYPHKSSTCLLVYEIFREADYLSALPSPALEALLTGMMTDTGGFSYNADDPEIFQAVSYILGRGVSINKINNYIQRQFTIDKIRLNAFAISQKMIVLEQYKTAIISLSKKEKEAYNYHLGDTEGLVNVPLEAKDIMFSIYIYEQKDYVKLSFRSKDPYPCNVFATEYFNGGGHRNASGAEFHGSMEQAMEAVLAALDKHHP